MTELIDTGGAEIVEGEEAASEAAGSGGLASPVMTDAAQDDERDDDDGDDDPPEAEGKASGAWVPYTGPKGGEGWREIDGDRVVYQDDPPGPVDASALAPEEQVEELVRRGADPDEVAEAVEAGDEGAVEDMLRSTVDGDVAADEATVTAAEVSEGDEILIDGEPTEVTTVKDMGGGFYIAGEDAGGEIRTARVGPTEGFDTPGGDSPGDVLEAGDIGMSHLEEAAEAGHVVTVGGSDEALVIRSIDGGMWTDQWGRRHPLKTSLADPDEGVATVDRSADAPEPGGPEHEPGEEVTTPDGPATIQRYDPPGSPTNDCPAGEEEALTRDGRAYCVSELGDDAGGYDVEPGSFGEELATAVGDGKPMGTDAIYRNMGKVDDPDLVADALALELRTKDRKTARERLESKLGTFDSGPTVEDVESRVRSGDSGLSIEDLEEGMTVRVDGTRGTVNGVGPYGGAEILTDDGELESFPPDADVEVVDLEGGDYPGLYGSAAEELEAMDPDAEGFVGEWSSRYGRSDYDLDAVRRLHEHASTAELEAQLEGLDEELDARELSMDEAIDLAEGALERGELSSQNEDLLERYDEWLDTNDAFGDYDYKSRIAGLANGRPGKFGLEMDDEKHDLVRGLLEYRDDSDVGWRDATGFEFNHSMNGESEAVVDSADDMFGRLDPAVGALTMTAVDSFEVGGVDVSDDAIGVYKSGSRRLIVQDEDPGLQPSTTKHEIGHAVQYALGVTGDSSVDNVDDAKAGRPSTWDMSMTPSGEGKADDLGADLRREIDRYKERAERVDTFRAECRSYQRSNANEFIAVTMAHWADDRQKLQRKHPEMVDLWDEQVGTGREERRTVEVDQDAGGRYDVFPEDVNDERVDIVMEDGEVYERAMIEVSDTATGIEAAHGPDFLELDADDVEAVRVIEGDKE